MPIDGFKQNLTVKVNLTTPYLSNTRLFWRLENSVGCFLCSIPVIMEDNW